MNIRSFEESTQDVFGDLLSRKRQREQIRVGLLLFGYFEYWRMFGDTLREKVEREMHVIEAHLREKYAIVCTDLVDTLDAAEMSSQILRESEIDALVLVMGTYVPDYITMHALKYVKEVPLLIFSAQDDGTVDGTWTYTRGARNSCMIGVAQLTATFRKIGRKCEVVVGSVDDNEAYEKISRFLRAIQALRDLQDANIGVIGNVFRGMYDIELSKTFLKGTFDVNVIYMQNAHLVEAWEQTDEREAIVLAERLGKRFRMREITAYDLQRACRLAIAMRRLVERYRLDALCLLDQHYIQKLFRTTARLGASLLLEEQHIPVCCEGDIGGIVMTMLMRSLSGKNPMQGEWAGYDEGKNACFISGHGVADPRMAKSDSDVTLTKTPEAWGLEGTGVNYEFAVKPGICTLGSVLETGARYSMLISRVESIETPELVYNDLYGLMKVGCPVKEYIERIFRFGVTQHCIVSHMDLTRELETVAELLELETLRI